MIERKGLNGMDKEVFFELKAVGDIKGGILCPLHIRESTDGGN